MADYTEKASLLVVDGSSAKINKINAALNRLAQTATKTQKTLNGLGGGGAATRINATAKAVNALARAMGKLPKTTTVGVKLRGNSAAELRSMARAMQQYKSASKNINTLIGAGGKSANFGNLDTLTQKLVRVARAANMAQTALGKMKTNMPGRGNFGQIPGMGTGRNGNYAIPRNIGLEIQPLKSWWRSAVVSLGHTITNAIQRGFAEGIKGYDVAGNKFAQQRITGQNAEQLRQQAFLGEQRAPIWRADERMDFYAEVASNFRDPRDAAKFDKSIERAIYTAVGQGGSRDEATTGVAQLLKGLGNAGFLQDAQGNLNKDIEKYIEAYVAAKTSEGAQLNFNDAAQVLKYARTSAQSLTPREFFLQLIAAADIGASTQGVQLNQTMKNYAGETTKKALQAQEDAGLRAPGRMVLSGQVGNRKSYTYEAGQIKDEELLRENQTEWIAKHITGPEGYLKRKGLDVNTSSSAQILAALDPLAGNRNVDDFIAKAVLQAQEREIKASKFFDNPRTDAEIQQIGATSSWVQLQETTQQLISLFGNLGDKLENIFIPVIDTVGNWAQRFNNIVEGKSRGEMQDYAVGAAGVAGVGAVGVGAWKAAGWLAGGFGLKASATALNVAAANLNAAALKLMAGSPAVGVDAAGKSKWSKAGLLALLGIGGGAVGGVLSLTHPSAEIQNRPDWLKWGPDDLIRKWMGTDKVAPINDAVAQSKVLSPQIAEQASQLTQWLQRLAEARDRQDYYKSIGATGMSDAAQQADMDAALAQQHIAELQASITEGSDKILSAFDISTAKLATVSENFGGSAAETLMGIASSFGTAAGAAMRQAIGTIGVNVNQPTPGPNTGTNTNLQTGG